MSDVSGDDPASELRMYVERHAQRRGLKNRHNNHSFDCSRGLVDCHLHSRVWCSYGEAGEGFFLAAGCVVVATMAANAAAATAGAGFKANPKLVCDNARAIFSGGH